VKNNDENPADIDNPFKVQKSSKIVRARLKYLRGLSKMKEQNIHEAHRFFIEARSLWDSYRSFWSKKDLTRIEQFYCYQLNKSIGTNLLSSRDILQKEKQLTLDNLKKFSLNLDLCQRIDAASLRIALCFSSYDHSTTIEQETLKELTHKDNFSWSEIESIGRFLTQLFYMRISYGHIEESILIAEVLQKLGDTSGCKNLTMIARCLLCEVYVINNDWKKASLQIDIMEDEFLLMDGRNDEIDCWTTIIKFSNLLITGNSPQTFSELVIWILPYGSKTFSSAQWTSLAIMIALIKTRISAFDSAFKWLSTVNDQIKICPMSFNLARSLVFRAEIDLIMYRNSKYCKKHLVDFNGDSSNERKQIILSLKKLKEIIEFFPIYKCFHTLFHGLFKFYDKNENPTKSIKDALREASKFNNESAKFIISKYEAYYCNDNDLFLHSWASQIIYSGNFGNQSENVIPYIIPKF
jgi:hypothetical protein